MYLLYIYLSLSLSLSLYLFYLILYITTSAQIKFFLSQWLQTYTVLMSAPKNKFQRPVIHILTPPSRNKAED